jgi:hypothetical protein
MKLVDGGTAATQQEEVHRRGESLAHQRLRVGPIMLHFIPFIPMTAEQRENSGIVMQ